MSFRVIVLFLPVLASMSSAGQTTQTVQFSDAEASAIGHLRTVNTAQFAYFYTYKKLACSLTNLASSKNGSPAGPDAARLLPDDLDAGQANGYTFTIHCEGNASAHMSAAPLAGQKGRAFCAEITSKGGDANGGLIHYSDRAATCDKEGKVLP